MCVATIGTTVGARKLVVEWSDAGYFLPGAAAVESLTFEAVYDEATGAIDFVYQSLPPPPREGDDRLTVGVEGHAGGEGVALCNQEPFTCGLLPGSRVRFTPTP